jgi:hypothetical protein
MSELRVVAWSPLGRFPAVVFDPGERWSAVACDGSHRAALSLTAPWCPPFKAQAVNPFAFLPPHPTKPRGSTWSHAAYS